MPTYDYRCEQCGKMQITQKITEPALDNCPNCHGPIKRIISRNVAILFKGSGFYCKDHSEYTGRPLPGREEGAPDFSDAYEKVEEKSVESPAASSETDKAGAGDSIKVNSETKPDKKASA